jgi:hypothetical protein
MNMNASKENKITKKVHEVYRKCITFGFVIKDKSFNQINNHELQNGHTRAGVAQLV